jgi:putative glutathione S-transferase
MTDTPVRFASPINAWQHGIYRSRRPTPESRPPTQFDLRVGVDVPAESGRFHLYAGRFCPWSHRLAILRMLAGLEDHLSVSYVDGLRDGRGWAFRAATGADPVNGFTLVREAYEATEPGFDGHVTVPVLWDRTTHRVVSNDPVDMGVDFAIAFGALATPLADVYPESMRERIEEFDSWLRPTITYGVGPAAINARAAESLVAGLRRLDTLLEHRTFVLGDQLTDADIRLWVTLVRYDVGPNAHGAIGPRLASFPNLWDYARMLYALDAFGSTTDFAAFTAPFAEVPDWDAPVTRGPAPIAAAQPSSGRTPSAKA